MTNVECQDGKFNFSITSDNSIKADCLILKGDSLMMKCSPNQFIVDLNSGTYTVELMKMKGLYIRCKSILINLSAKQLMYIPILLIQAAL